MKIVLASHVFHPGVGGIETMSTLLASEFVAQGHEVKVVTHATYDGLDQFPFEVWRGPSPQKLLNLLRWCDVYFHNNISLKTIWPLLFVRRPWVVANHTWIARSDESLGWQDRLKRFLLRYATCISVSQAVADHVAVPSTIIGNPYRNDLVRPLEDVPRNKDIVFLGRLVSDKGADLLIDVLQRLKEKGVVAQLTIIGEGIEYSNLQQQAEALGVKDQVSLAGHKSGNELVHLLNEHRILVVPSRWKEPFGIVALEGLACGCVVVGSEGGGLKDAIGNCGVTFPNGDAAALAEIISDLLSNPQKLVEYRAQTQQHLEDHQSPTVAAAYLNVFQGVIR